MNGAFGMTHHGFPTSNKAAYWHVRDTQDATLRAIIICGTALSANLIRFR